MLCTPEDKDQRPRQRIPATSSYLKETVVEATQICHYVLRCWQLGNYIISSRMWNKPDPRKILSAFSLGGERVVQKLNWWPFVISEAADNRTDAAWAVSVHNALAYSVDMNFWYVIKTDYLWQHSAAPARCGQEGEELYQANWPHWQLETQGWI